MGNPNDSGEDRFIEKLGRAEDQAEGGRLKRLVIIYLLIAAILSFSIVAAALAAEPEGVSDVMPKGRGVQLTRPDGSPIYINPMAVAYVRESLDGEAGKATIVFSNGAKQAVMETVAEVIADIHIDKIGEGDDPP